MSVTYLAYGDYNSGLEAAIVGVLYLFGFLLSIVGYLIASFLLMKVFDKAGVQGRWRAWVPIYNTLVLAKLGDMSPWIVLGIIVAGAIPILNVLAGLAGIVAFVMIAWRVNAKFGKDWPLLLLFLLGPLGVWIWLGILGFGSARFQPAIAPAPWAQSFLADKTMWNGIPVQPGQHVQGPPAGGYAAPTQGYGQPQSPQYPPAGGYPPPPAGGATPPPAGGATPPPPAPPASGTTPPPPAPPSGPQV